MKRNRYLLAAGLGALSVAAGGAFAAMPAYSAAASKHKKARSATVLKVSRVSVGGAKMSILVDGSGHVVYLLTGDSTKHALCTSSSCLAYWPAVKSSTKKPHVARGIKGRVSVWHHHGMNQVTINGHPLYTFVGDGGAGQANGQAQKSFGGIWEVLTARGAAVTAKVKSSTGGSRSGGGSGPGGGSGSGGSYGSGY